MSFDTRFAKIIDLAAALPAQKARFITLAARDLKFTARDTGHEVDLTVERLQMFAQTWELLAGRRPLRGLGSWVSLMLSYNGSAWLNTVIASCYLVGNLVLVKLSSKAAHLRALLESIYRPIFGTDIAFYQGRGQDFMAESLARPETSTVVVFGFDARTLGYRETFKKSGKKLVFEGPGVDPFIVFPDADLDLALNDLMMAKFMYSGQTCTAPKRIFIQEAVYDDFLARLVAWVSQLRAGEPEDPRTDISEVASGLAVARIKES